MLTFSMAFFEALSQNDAGPLFWSHDQRYRKVSFTPVIFRLGQPKIASVYQPSDVRRLQSCGVIVDADL